MKSWNTPDHQIADTDHGSLHFENGQELVIADWEVTENAPDSDGRVYATIRGWLVNHTGSGKLGDPYHFPVEDGRARLVRSELRGREPITHQDVHIDFHCPGRPHPNSWDHAGYLVTITWMDRRIDADGQPIPEDEIGRTEWTDPTNGQIFDLGEAYVPKGEFYDDFTWQHFDRWSGGVPLLHPFYAHARTPSGSGRRITDGEWVKADDAPRLSERLAASF